MAGVVAVAVVVEFGVNVAHGVVTTVLTSACCCCEKIELEPVDATE